MLATVIAAAKISFATFAMISFSAMFIDAQKIGLHGVYSNHASLSCRKPKVVAAMRMSITRTATTNGGAKMLTKDEAQRIAANIAKLPELLGRK